MTTYECYTIGSSLIEADSAEEARIIFADLILSETMEEFIAADEVEE